MRPDKVHATVYLAAYMLSHGERVADYFRQDKDSLIRANLRIHRSSLTDSLTEHAQGSALYADYDEADVELARSLVTDEPSLPALSCLRLSTVNYGQVTRHSIHLTQDKAASSRLQEKMIARTSCASVTKIDASHSAYFSQPLELSKAIAQIAQT